MDKGDGPGNAAVLGQLLNRLLDAVGLMADDHADRSRLERVGQPQGVENHGTTAHWMKNLRDGRFHPGALARGQYQNRQGPAAFMIHGYRHKTSFPRPGLEPGITDSKSAVIPFHHLGLNLNSRSPGLSFYQIPRPHA